MDIFRKADGTPLLPLGLQAHNSSTGDPRMLVLEIAAVILLQNINASISQDL